MQLKELINDITNALLEVDRSGLPFKEFKAGVGPYSEPQLLRLVADALNGLEKYENKARTKRTPDLLIPGSWALEFKIARPFGDNARKRKIGR